MSFQSSIDEIKQGRLKPAFSDDTTVPGTFCITASVASCPYPLGIAWYRFDEPTRISLLNIYVVENVRRNGVGKFLIEQLAKGYPCVESIYTWQGNKLSTPWMKATGWTKDKRGWHYRTKRSK